MGASLPHLCLQDSRRSTSHPDLPRGPPCPQPRQGSPRWAAATVQGVAVGSEPPAPRPPPAPRQVGASGAGLAGVKPRGPGPGADADVLGQPRANGHSPRSRPFGVPAACAPGPPKADPTPSPPLFAPRPQPSDPTRASVQCPGALFVLHVNPDMLVTLLDPWPLCHFSRQPPGLPPLTQPRPARSPGLWCPHMGSRPAG